LGSNYEPSTFYLICWANYSIWRMDTTGGITMEIIVEIKSVYGNRSIYPVCAKSKILADLAGTKTFTNRALDSIKALGYSIQVKQQEITI